MVAKTSARNSANDWETRWEPCQNTTMRVSMILLLTVALRADSVSLTYLGTAGWQIENGKTVILIDPYLTRVKSRSPNDDVSPDDPRPVATPDSVVGSDTAVIDAHIKKADFIFLTHTHTDHSLDMPYIARKTGARVIGTESTANVARAYDIPERQIQVVKGGEQLKFDGFSVRVIRSVHGIFRKPAPGENPVPPPLVPAGLKAPLRLGQHVEGGTLAYLIEIQDQRILVFGSMNYIQNELTDLRPNVALIGAMPERNNIENYTARLMEVLGNPPVVIPTHWDRFNVPYSVSQEPAVQRLQSFIEEIKSVSPKTRVIVPEYFKPIILD
jgi:L-ascorbate metabolism protein UlaG (beta-lactamase superfamily)